VNPSIALISPAPRNGHSPLLCTNLSKPQQLAAQPFEAPISTPPQDTSLPKCMLSIGAPRTALLGRWLVFVSLPPPLLRVLLRSPKRTGGSQPDATEDYRSLSLFPVHGQSSCDTHLSPLSNERQLCRITFAFRPGNQCLRLLYTLAHRGSRGPCRA
jgi:hypothetical protein